MARCVAAAFAAAAAVAVANPGAEVRVAAQLTGRSTAPSTAPSAGQAVARSTAAAQGDAMQGIALYDEHCAGCHGPTGAGDGPLVDRLPSPPPSLADRTRMAALSAADLWTTVTNGRLERGMPPFSRLLTDDERWHVVAAVRAFGDQHPLVLAAADEAWARGCASCHGPEAAFARALAAGPAPSDAPPRADGLAIRSPAAMRTAFGAVSDHGAVPIDGRVVEAALAGLRRHGSEPLVIPGAAPGGRIEGVVVAPDGAAVRAAQGATLTLEADALGLGIDLGAVALSAAGSFAVDGLVVGDGIAYEPVATFEGVRYRATEAVTLTVQSPHRGGVELRVYPADPGAPVRIAALSGLAKADPERGELAVFEVWQIANEGQRTRVSADGEPTFRLPLPIGARDVVLEDRTGRDEVARRSDASAEGYIASRLPVPPGGREIVASYAMPYRGTTATLVRDLVDGADALAWVLADDGAAAESDLLGQPTADTFGGQMVRRYVGGAAAAGQPWSIRVSGLPPATAAPGSPQDVLGPVPTPLVPQSDVRRIAVVAAAAAVLAVLLVALSAGGGMRRATPRAHADRRTARAYDRVIASIARLDVANDRGEVAPNTHRRRRAALVARALALRAAAGLDAEPGMTGARAAPAPGTSREE